MKNNFSSQLTLTKVWSNYARLEVLSIKGREFKANNSRVMLFTLRLTEDTKLIEFIQTHVALQFNNQFTVPVPFVVFDKKLHCRRDNYQGRCSV